MIGRRWHTLVLVAAVLAVGSLLAPGRAAPTAASDGPCPGTTGVTVVVDYQNLGGGLVVRCAPGSPSTGFKALTAAGFHLEEVRNVPGFLCRIDGKPGPADDTCINTPPAAAYWSYWHAARGGTWATSAEGAKTRTPPPGSVEGWSFSDDGSPSAASPPGIPPPAKPKPASPKPTPTPKPATPKPTTTPRPTTTPKPESTAQPIDTPAPLDTPTPIPSSAATAATLTTAAGQAEASPTPPVGTTAIADSGTVSDGSPPVGTLLGFGLVVLISLGALVARSRRSTDPGSDA